MRGLNKVIVSGNVTGKIDYATTDNGSEVCTFVLASDRHGSGGVVTAYIKINVYVDGLVKLCRNRLDKGSYVLVEGELMNRSTPSGKLTEVRAWEVIFLSEERQRDGRSDRGESGGSY
jgi:single-stranded DNA-binding protein